MRPPWIQGALNPLRVPLQNTERPTQRAALCGWRQRLLGDGSTSQEHWHPPGHKGEAWARPLRASRRGQPCPHPDSQLLVSRTVREHISVVLSHLVGSYLFQQPQKATSGQKCEEK